MHPRLVERKRDVEELCRRHGVERLEVFGSASRDDYDDSSDFDFIVRFQNTGEGYSDRFYELAESLEDVLGRSVDLMTERSLRNPIFVKSIMSDRTTLYAA